MIQPPSRIGRIVALGGPAASASTIGPLTYLHAPWWPIAIIGIITGLGVLLAAIARIAENTLPQESNHRLDWWRARWDHHAGVPVSPAQPDPEALASTSQPRRTPRRRNAPRPRSRPAPTDPSSQNARGPTGGQPQNTERGGR